MTAVGGAVLLVALHDHFTNKPAEGTFGRIEKQGPYRNAELDPLELADHIGAGKAWIGCHLSKGARADENAGPANLIVLDIDGDISLDAFWQISTAQRHCLFSYASPSHQRATDRNPAAADRFRAVFLAERHDDSAFHAALYHRVLDGLGLKLADNCGEKRERLWFGNNGAAGNADLRWGGGQPLPHEWLDDARDAVKREAAAAAVREAERRSLLADLPTDGDREVERCIYVLRHLLPGSRHGDGVLGYDAYWQKVLNAAASGGPALFDAFAEWSSKGEHHAKEARRLEAKFQKAGRSSNIGVLCGLAKQFDPQWIQKLPLELRPPMRNRTAVPGVGMGSKPPTIIARAGSDSAPGGAAIPSVVPSPEQLQAMADTSSTRFGMIASDRGPIGREAGVSGGPTAAADMLDPSEAERLIKMLADLQLQQGRFGRQTMSDSARDIQIDMVESELFAKFPKYRQAPEKLTLILMKKLREAIGIPICTDIAPDSRELTGYEDDTVEWLINGFIMKADEHLLHATSGTGKTLLSMHIARAVTGDPSMDSFLDSGPLNNSHLWKKSKVLFINTDMGHKGSAHVTTYVKSQGMAGMEFLKQVEWWSGNNKERKQPWTATLPKIIYLHETLAARRASGTPITLVIIDSMKSILPDGVLIGQQNAKEYLETVAEVCQFHGAALLWIHHSNPEGRSQGIQSIHERPSAEFVLTKNEEANCITMHVKKIRGGSGSRKLDIKIFKSDRPILVSSESSIGAAGGGAGGGETTDDALARCVLQALSSHFNQYRIANPSLLGERLMNSYMPNAMPRNELDASLQVLSRRGLCITPTRKPVERVLQRLMEDGAIRALGHGKGRRYATAPASGFTDAFAEPEDHEEQEDAFSDFC